MTRTGRGKRWLWLGAALAFAAFLGVDALRRGAAAEPREHRHAFETMRTQAHFLLLESEGLRAPPAHILQEAEKAVREVERLMNPHREGSDLWRLNRAEPGAWVSVDPSTWEVVMEALRFHRLTGGAFDPTVGPLKRLYFPGGQPRTDLPSDAERAAAMERVGAGKLRFDREGLRLAWAAPGMSLDLSALAKGYSVDRAMLVLLAYGARDAMVEVGGELRVAGTVPKEGLGGSRLDLGAPRDDPDARSGRHDGPAPVPTSGARRPWRLWVMDPRNPDLPPSERFYLSRTDAAVASSGDYEQYFEVDGVRYSHLLDPRSGWPVRAAVAATVALPAPARSVTYPCMQADALATALCVLGPKAGAEFMRARGADLFVDGAEAWVFTLAGDGRPLREAIVVAGEGVGRMAGEPPPEPVAPETLDNDIAAETRWIDGVLNR